MRIIRIVFGLIAAAWLIGVMAFGVGTTWLMNDPDAAVGVALGAASVDGESGVLENAESFAGGFTAGSALSAKARELEAKHDLRGKCAEQADSDWGAPAECDALAESDRETYERLSTQW